MVDAGRSGGQDEDLGLVDGLVQLSFAIQRVLARIALERDFSLAQVRLLGILRDREPGMLEVAAFLGLDKSSVSGLVDRAERRGLVRRVSTLDDRRAVLVSLTSRGREVARQFAAQVERELTRLAEGLSETDRKRLSRLATRIVAKDAQGALKTVAQKRVTGRRSR